MEHLEADGCQAGDLLLHEHILMLHYWYFPYFKFTFFFPDFNMLFHFSGKMAGWPGIDAGFLPAIHHDELPFVQHHSVIFLIT